MAIKNVTIFLLIIFSVFMLFFSANYSFAISIEKIQSIFVQKYGSSTLNLISGWVNLIDSIRDAKSDEKLKRVNEYFNRKILWSDDMKVWGQADYWASPLETIAKGSGDCEDFAIVKYFTLMSVGVPISKLRLVYVKAKNGNTPTGGTADQAHMVMAYYPAPEADPLILDNLITEIRPASRRPDLEPVFSFNSEGIFAGAAGQQEQSSSRLSKWQELLQKTKAEGFE
jgi:predicted transglutaminase-like cysteine proteinase